jgi:hypothetical protein
MKTAWTAAWAYADELNDRGYPKNKAGRDASIKPDRELPVLRRDLEVEFRAGHTCTSFTSHRTSCATK